MTRAGTPGLHCSTQAIGLREIGNVAPFPPSSIEPLLAATQARLAQA